MNGPEAGVGGGIGETVRYSVTDGVATVMIDDPGRRNAVTRETCQGLIEAFRRADADDSVAAVVLRGAGGTFSAGAAIDQIESVLLDASGGGDPVDWLSAADEALCAVSKPTFSFVEGACFGGAWMLASAADVCLLSSDARLAITPAKLGILYPRRGLERLLARVGEDRAKYVLFTAEEVPAEKAEAWGLATRVVEASVFEAECARVVAVTVSRSQHSLREMKAFLTPPAGSGDREARWGQAWRKFSREPEAAAGISAFLARQRHEAGAGR